MPVMALDNDRTCEKPKDYIYLYTNFKLMDKSFFFVKSEETLV